VLNNNEISLKHSNLLQECSKLEDEKQELLKMLEEMRSEIKMNQQNIENLFDVEKERISPKKGGYLDLGSSDAENREDYGLARKSEKSHFDSVRLEEDPGSENDPKPIP
jgi:hypothetical protein